MAQAKKKPQTKADPFKTRKTRQTASKGADTLTPPAKVREAIDSFRQAQDQAKHYEGEATVYKDMILAYSIEEYCKRCLIGQPGSFKLLGGDSMVNYIVQDSSAGLTEEEVAEFVERWGEDAGESLITKDYASIRFDGKVLEAHYEKVVQALQALPEEVLDHLFKPMLMKATLGAVEVAKKYAKSPDELVELLKQLKIKNYIK